MKKFLSVIICMTLLLSSLCISSFAAGTIRYSVDAKPGGVYEKDTDTLHVMGWAFDTSGAKVSCYYSIDNGAEIQVELSARYDVASVFSSECSQTDCGFNKYISLADVNYGEHTFKFIARSLKNEAVLFEGAFTVAGIVSDCNQLPSGNYNVDDTNVLTVCGWAFNYSGENTDCYYQIDDYSKVIIPRMDRSDVQTVFSGCKQVDCGFYTNIPTSEFTIGSHSLKIIAVSGSNEKIIGSSTVEIECKSSSFKNYTDHYPSGTYSFGTTEEIFVGGWVFSTDGNETSCYYQIDNRDIVLIKADNRSDVVAAFPGSCSQLNCGYSTNISFADLSKGAHKFRLIAKNNKISQVIKETDIYIVGTDGTLKYNSECNPEGTYTLGNVNYAIVQGWGYNTSAEQVKFYCQFDKGSRFYLDVVERTDVFNLKEDCYRSDCGYHKAINLGNLSSGSHSFTVYITSGGQTQRVTTCTFEITRLKYTISFNANGGTNAPDSLVKSFGKNLALPSELPTRKYYNFVGWNTSADGSGQMIENSYKYDCDDVLYAIWEHEEFKLKPDSSLCYDAKSKLIYGEALINLSSDALKNNFDNTSVSVSDKSVITGTEICISDFDGVYDSACTVILGDINCDGKIDGTDAVVAECIESGMLSEEELGSASYSASDCVRNGNVDMDDIDKIFNVGIMIEKIDQSVVKSRGVFDTDFTIAVGDCIQNSVMLNGKNTQAEIVSALDNYSVTLNADCDIFNYYGFKYSSSAYVKGTITYKLNNKNYSEDFFLEPGENEDFRSYIDGIFEKETSDNIVSLSFSPLDSDKFIFSVSGLATFYREIPQIVTYYQNESIKIGLNMEWGGSLSYYEDIDSNVQAVSDQGIIRIESNGAEKFNSESLNDNVNLINCHDTGRLVQQAYYGTHNYDRGFFNGSYFPYNPVQGGNMYNDSSKIVDLQIIENGIYIKCRPLDWAKEKEYMTKSYMEATYTLFGETLKTKCRFIDYSGYDSASATQELPAFYGVATMDKFVYYGGDEPWTDGELSTATQIDEYALGYYPSFSSTEHWGALTGEAEDSFGIGLYVPTADCIVSGVYGSITEQNANPDTSNPTSYMSGKKTVLFQSYDPIEYDYYITTGTIENIRNNFKNIRN